MRSLGVLTYAFLIISENSAFVTNGRTDGRTDRQTDQRTDGRTDIPSYRDARTHLKIDLKLESVDHEKKFFKA